MAPTSSFAGNCVITALVLIGAVGAGACVSIQVRDLQFVGLRKVAPEERATFPRTLRSLMTNEGYLDSEFVEATFSTKRDLVAVASRDDAWMPGSRVWRCQSDRANGRISDWPQFYYQRKEVGPLMPYQSPDEVATADDVAKTGPYFYTVYFRVRDKWRPNWPEKAAYDLAKAPMDICVNFGAAGYMRSIMFETNTVTIPATKFEALFAAKRKR